MNLEEIKAKYQPRQLESQMEFDRIMSEINIDQEEFNRELHQRERELKKQLLSLRTQVQAINIRENMINTERLDIDETLKANNKVFHQLKHELIIANPRELFERKEEDDEGQ